MPYLTLRRRLEAPTSGAPSRETPLLLVLFQSKKSCLTQRRNVINSAVHRLPDCQSERCRLADVVRHWTTPAHYLHKVGFFLCIQRGIDLQHHSHFRETGAILRALAKEATGIEIPFNDDPQTL